MLHINIVLQFLANILEEVGAWAHDHIEGILTIALIMIAYVLVIIVPTAVMNFFKYNGDAWFDFVTKPIQVLAEVLARLINLLLTPIRHRADGIFKQVFGFDHMRVNDESQAIVNRQLAVLAQSFLDAAEDEHSAENKGQLKTLKKATERYKDRFWRAHELAKKRGYVVHSKVGEYVEKKSWGFEPIYPYITT